jgi:hypothetical protein
MARNLTIAQLAELNRLRLACIAILDFVVARGNLAEFASEFRKVVEEAYEKRSLKGLRIIRRDFQEWIGDLPPSARTELERGLRSIEGQALDDQLSAAIGRGRILTEEECRVVLARVEDIYADPAARNEVELLNRLLADFDRRVRTRD